MKRSLSLATKVVTIWIFVLLVVAPLISIAQNKVTPDKKPDAVITKSKNVKPERIEKHTDSKKKKVKKHTTVSPNPSADDKKLKQIKEEKSKLRAQSVK